MQLTELQSMFNAALLGMPLDTHYFQGNENLITERFNIYSDSIKAGRIAALTRLFPCCEKMVGGDYWQYLTESFVAQHPSPSADITAAGAQFSQFIRLHTVHEQLPYLADLAQLEWLWQQCFHHALPAKNLGSLTAAIENAGEQLTLTAASGVQLTSSYYPLDELWLLCQQSSDKTLELKKTAMRYYFLLHREDASIVIKRVAEETWYLCNYLLQNDHSLVNLCERYQRDHQHEFKVATLVELVQNNIITWRM